MPVWLAERLGTDVQIQPDPARLDDLLRGVEH
jgi:hypothetical protein